MEISKNDTKKKGLVQLYSDKNYISVVIKKYVQVLIVSFFIMHDHCYKYFISSSFLPEIHYI